MPGKYGVKSGYVYAILCAYGVVKIGSTVCPRQRIGEQCYHGRIWAGWPHTGKSFRVQQIILSGVHRECRKLEKAMHRSLKPFQFGQYNSERYKLTEAVTQRLGKLFSTPLSESRITAFAKKMEAA